MRKFTPRQKEILEGVVEEYIKNASPISSSFLKKSRHLGVSSATIRLDFVQLTKAGFLKKPYLSGGRIPTDKGYRFFVDNLFEREAFEKEGEFFSELSAIFKNREDILRFSHEIAKKLAFLSSNLAIVFLEDFGLFWKEGWEGIFQIPEFQDFDYLRKFTELVNDLEENIKKLTPSLKTQKINVYIGKESPLRRKEFCLILTKIFFPKTTFAILGPKRMDFKRNISLLKYLIEKERLFS